MEKAGGKSKAVNDSMSKQKKRIKRLIQDNVKLNQEISGLRNALEVKDKEHRNTLEVKDEEHKNALKVKDAEIGLLKNALEAKDKENAELKEELSHSKTTAKAMAAKAVKAKPNRKKGKKGKGKNGKGRKKSESKHTRKGRKVPEEVDETITVDQENCPVCGEKLSEKKHTHTRTITDMVVPKPKIIKLIITTRYCRTCKKSRAAPVKEALPNARFSLRFEVFVTVLKYLGVSYRKIQYMVSLLGISITGGALNGIIIRMGRRLRPLYDQLLKELKQAGFIHIDETIWRKDGVTHWLWVFVGMWTTIIEINQSRGSAVPKRVLEGYAGVTAHDSWPACNSIGSAQQKCHIHYKREIKDTIKYKNPTQEFIVFARRLKRILNDSRKYEEMDLAGIEHGEKLLLKRVDKLIAGTYTDRHCKRFVKRLKRERNMLFTFLAARIDCHNNRAERAIRPHVMLRKDSNGNRSDEGVESHQVIMSIQETCKQRKTNYWDLLVEKLTQIALKNETIDKTI